MADWVPIAALIFSLVAATASVAFVARARRARRSPQAPAAEGAVALIENGTLVACGTGAPDLAFAKGEDGEQALRRVFGEGGAGDTAAHALAEALRTGEPADHLLNLPDGRPVHLRLRALGAVIRLSIHDLSGLERALAGLTGPGGAGLPASSDPLGLLLGSGAMMLWQRDAAGNIVSAEGSVHVAGDAAEAAEATALLAGRRPGGSGAPAPDDAGILRTRIELTRGGDRRLPLQVTEVEAPDGAGVGFAIEATGTMAAERTLTRFVQTMTETFAHLNVGLAIFDRNQTLALFNPALVGMWRLEPAWLARRPHLREILDNLRSARRIPDLRDYHEWRGRLLGLLENPEHADYEELWTLADGTTIRVLARPHPHGSLAFIFDDVTERMRLEQRNRHMTDLLHSTLDRLHEGLAVFGSDGTLKYLNEAFHDIWDTDTTAVTLGVHVSDLAELARRVTVDTDVWERMVAFATGMDNRRAWTARITMGSGRLLGARFAPLPDGSTMAVFADVTDSERIAAALQERNEALEAAEQMRGAVLDQISHRLRTPLNTIFGFGELLASPRLGPLNPRQKGYAEGILEAASQLLDTVSEVTELASLQIDPLDGEEPGHGVEEVLAMTRTLLEKRAVEKGVALAVEIEGQVGLVECNAARLRQIVFNLAADAIHRSSRGGRVVLSARRDDDGTVEIGTREETPAGEDMAPSGLELRSLTLSLVRRLVAGEGGALEVVASPDARTLSVLCRFPDTSAPAALVRSAG